MSDTAKVQSALVNAMKGMTAPKLDGTGHHRNQFTTLPTLIRHVRKALTDNGLWVIQPIQYEDGANIVETRIIHTSGESLSSRMAITIPEMRGANEAQAVASGTSYARRVAMLATLGLAGSNDDDDGNAGSEPDLRQPKPAAPRPAPVGDTRPITRTQVIRLKTIAGTNGWSVEDGKALLSRFGYTTSTDIQVRHYNAVIACIEEARPPTDEEIA